MEKKLFFLLNIFLILCLIIAKVKAQDISKGLIINEIMPNPSGSDTLYEWIELKNTSTEILNLNTWQLNSKSLPNQTIQPNEIIILARDVQSIINLYKINNKILKYSFSLNNLGGQLEIKMGDNTNLFTFPKAKENISFELLSGDCNTVKEHPTANSIGKENSSCNATITTVPINYNEKVNITKVCPFIKNGKEYLEIKNLTNSIIDLEGWKLADLKSSESLAKLSISAQQTISIYPKKITLNDDGDIIQLSHPNNGYTSTMTYPKMKDGECFPSISKPTNSISILPPASNTKPIIEISKDNNAKAGVGLGLKLDLKIPKLFRIVFSF
jgi:hypothetical protein